MSDPYVSNEGSTGFRTLRDERRFHCFMKNASWPGSGNHTSEWTWSGIRTKPTSRACGVSTSEEDRLPRHLSPRPCTRDRATQQSPSKETQLSHSNRSSQQSRLCTSELNSRTQWSSNQAPRLNRGLLCFQHPDNPDGIVWATLRLHFGTRCMANSSGSRTHTHLHETHSRPNSSVTGHVKMAGSWILLSAETNLYDTIGITAIGLVLTQKLFVRTPLVPR